MSRFSFEYEFDEVNVPRYGDGMFLDGKATLSDNDGDGDFYVSDIDIGGRSLDRRDPLDNYLFKEIASQLYVSQHAASEYVDAWNESRQPDPDRARDERRDHEAMGWM